MSQTEDQIEDSSAPLIEHLAELRNRLIKAAIAFVIAMFAVFTVEVTPSLGRPFFNFLASPICDTLISRGQDCNLILIKLQEGFFVTIRISLMIGFALAFPFIGFQLWRFVAPGLYRSEKNAFMPFLIASPFMFFLGGAFAYYVVMPLAYDFFLNFQQVGQGESAQIDFQGSAGEYLSLTVTFILAFGMCFQLPVLLSLLGKAGLVSAEGLVNVRKYAVVAILVVAGLVTPPDVFTQVILFVVVYGLYEISIQLVKRIEKNREAKLRAEGAFFEEDYEDDDADDAEGWTEEDADTDADDGEGHPEERT
ncbi:Twin-arginine translocation protein TatC [Candidatus Rhodobacter oscarellae]|uniref:Sec-independent protein translocase protein TatC n=1 Tax=Candidatus Rhodobacter oscarellae TaxID=1675527 RepID=A0A0J9E9L3_9RHOB|nr:twin-arginine translocase subunit TatC [Candidatus Rhodobacter lobularis]KMW58359.1 Twin-arginine translocation protein TatC [Candidatus Rhodobacter lobularis]